MPLTEGLALSQGQQQQQRYMQQQPKPQAPPQQLTKTATIRNSVNLKKSSLGVKAAPGNPHQLRICFTFDASAPCRRVHPPNGTRNVLLLHSGCLGPHMTDMPQPGICNERPWPGHCIEQCSISGCQEQSITRFRRVCTPPSP